MLSIFRVQLQRFRIILGETSQIIIAIKQWCKNFFFTVLQAKHMSIFLALQVSSNLIFRSLDFVVGNQAEINDIFLLIKILKYLIAFTALLIYYPKCNAEFPKTVIFYFLTCKFKIFYQKVSDLARLVSLKNIFNSNLSF